MAAQRAQAQQRSVDEPDGFGVAVVREEGKWRCTALRAGALTSLSAAETELRELRSAGAVFGILDIDDEFFLILRPAPSGTRLLLSDATAALDYDIAAEALETLDADISAEDLEAGRLVPVMQDYRPVEFSINAIYQHRQHLSIKVRSFIDLLAERITQHRHWMHPGY